MTKAAGLLHVAQPALGLQIRLLEEDLGIALLERHSRGVSVTPAGRLLYERACEILQLFSNARADVMAFGEARRETLTLGVTPSIMRLLGSDLLVAAQREAPNIFLSLVEEPSFVLADRLESGDVDLALAYEIGDRRGLQPQPLIVEELLLITQPENAPSSPTVSFRDAVALDLVLIHERDMIRQMVETEAQRQNIPVKVVYEVQSLQATQQVVLEGLVASILPYGTVAEELKSGELVSRRIENPRLSRKLYMARAERRNRFANEDDIMQLIDWVVKRLSRDLGQLAEPLEIMPST